MEPKKLIRRNITKLLKEGEWEVVEDSQELNDLYHLKIEEELQEIVNSDHKDISEFADLLSVVLAFAEQNRFSNNELFRAMDKKNKEKGVFNRIALNNLNPHNPSNALYFEEEKNQINFAVQQLLGYHYSKTCNLDEILSSMNLSKEEWIIMKRDYSIEFLESKDIEAIDLYFENNEDEEVQDSN